MINDEWFLYVYLQTIVDYNSLLEQIPTLFIFHYSLFIIF